MTCSVCQKVLRRDNTIGTCRKHRGLSKIRRTYEYNWKESNKEQYREVVKQWKEANRAHLKIWYNNYLLDIEKRLAHSLRTRMRKICKNKVKTGSAVKDLGCSVSEFKLYLEKLFKPGMTWENYGEWHIDHISPLSRFKLENREQFLKAAHYTNLQPLWALDNLKKGNRIE